MSFSVVFFLSCRICWCHACALHDQMQRYRRHVDHVVIVISRWFRRRGHIEKKSFKNYHAINWQRKFYIRFELMDGGLWAVGIFIASGGGYISSTARRTRTIARWLRIKSDTISIPFFLLLWVRSLSFNQGCLQFCTPIFQHSDNSDQNRFDINFRFNHLRFIRKHAPNSVAVNHKIFIP